MGFSKKYLQLKLINLMESRRNIFQRGFVEILSETGFTIKVVRVDERS